MLVLGEAAAGHPGGIVHPEAARAIAALPGWTVRPLPASHDVRRDAPEATAAALADLVRSVAA